MGIGEDFQSFCSALVVRNRDSIARRCRLITRRLNLDFWDTDSKTLHSFYSGSYGRGTAIHKTSDVDLIFQLPPVYYEKYDKYLGNGQSALLQEVRNSIKKTYTVTNIGADGQVVQIPFDDGLTFEVVPAFRNVKNRYTFPDSNNGGRWKVTNPKPEIQEINTTNISCNNNLKWLARMARTWKRQWDVPISGLLIDTLAYQFIKTWPYRDKSFLYYDWMCRDFFEYLSSQPATKLYWLSPGAGQFVWRKGNFEYKAKRCQNISIQAINYYTNNHTWSARQRWREVFGTDFPG